MKKYIIASTLVASASITNATPVEKGADIYPPITKEFAGVLGDTLKASGYTCDSVSGAVKRGNGFRINCNGYRYTYEIKDVGGTWRIFVK